MESPEQINKSFNEIAASEFFDVSSAEERIQSMATDERLVHVVYGELAAQLEVAFEFMSDKSHEDCEKNFYNAKESTFNLAIHLQHEYGLSDEDTLKAVELARLDIQGDNQLYD